MKNWNDPEVEAKLGRATIMLYHVLFGVYVWEWATSLSYDWEIIRRKRRLGLGTSFYLAARYCALVAMCLILPQLTVYDPNFDCKGNRYAVSAFGYGAVAFASGLLYVRLVALSDRNKWVVWGLGIAHLGAWALTFECVRWSDATYNPHGFACTPTNLSKFTPVKIYMFGFDLICLCVMMGLLWRMHHGPGIWRLLVAQGVVYFIVMTTAYLATIIVFIWNFSENVSRMTIGVLLVVVVVCATRMQRALDDYVRRPPPTTSGGNGTTASTNMVWSAPQRQGSVQGGRPVHVTVETDTTFEVEVKTDGQAYRLDRIESGSEYSGNRDRVGYAV